MLDVGHWLPDWTGETAIVIASGPSASEVDLEPARGQVRAIAINRSWELAPWADILYATDAKFWDHYQGATEFPGMRLSGCKFASARWRIPSITVDKKSDEPLLTPKGVVGWGGNSGYHGLQLAMQFGCRKLIMVGFDMTIDQGGHWHEDHGGTCHNPTTDNVARWRRATERLAPLAQGNGIRVFNTSPRSALRSFPKVSLEKALAA